MFDSPLGYWEIVPFADSSRADQYVDLDTGFEAFLRQFKSDYGVMGNLRSLLLPTDMPSRLNGDQVIRIIASRLQSNQLFLRVKPYVRRGSSGGSEKQNPAAAPAPSGSSVPAPRVEEAEANTFGSGHDPNAQAAALASAAEDGIPFCEECERQRRAAA